MRKYYLIIFMQLISIYAARQAEISINEVMSSNKGFIYDIDGDSSDWVELYNHGKKTSLKDYMLTIGKNSYILDDIYIERDSYLLLWFSGKKQVSSPLYNGLEHHIPGKLSKDGFLLELKNTKGKIIDSLEVPKLSENQSYSSIGILSHPTPKYKNSPDQLISNKKPTPPEFSFTGGFYKEDLAIELTTDDPQAIIYYTLDGSEPTLLSTKYESIINIKDRTPEENILSSIKGTSENYKNTNNNSYKGTVVRAFTYVQGHHPSEIISNTYFINKRGGDRYSFPVVSISTNSSNLFDYERGIYMLGIINERWKKLYPKEKIQGDNPANYNQRGKGWAVPVSMEYFDTDGSKELSVDSTMRVMGGWTRENPVKSLRLDFEDDIPNKVFPDINREKLDSVVLRTSANDWNYTLFRDSLMTSLVDDLVETQESRPVILFLNGEYWGIHNIRERITEDFIADHRGLNKKDIVILEGEGEFSEGNKKLKHNYNQILDYIKEHGVAESKDYNYIKKLIDIDNFIDYIAIQVFYGNSDWPGNNIRYWQDAKNNTPWRWILYDTDFGFGLYDWNGGIYNNTIELMMDPNGDLWPNPPWSTFLFRSLMDNSEFRSKYISRFDELLNSRFSKDNINKEIDNFVALYKPEIQEHIDRWGIMDGSARVWLKQVQRLRDFARLRGSYIKKSSDERLK